MPEADGNGSSTTVFVNSGRMVYNPTEIATTAMMTIIIIVAFFISQNLSYWLDSFALPNRVEKASHQIRTVLYFDKSVPVGIS